LKSLLARKFNCGFGIWLFLALCFQSLVSAAAPPQGKWEIRTPMPSTRTEVAAVELGGKIYVMGGLEKNGDLLEEYDPAKDRWGRRASLPRPLHHVGAAAVGGKIYVIGGRSIQSMRMIRPAINGACGRRCRQLAVPWPSV
jgi:N-acetylneuraminic acid mutarotase